MTLPVPPHQVRIATYNFENMGSGKSSDSLKPLADTLQSMNADVVVFEEVKSLPVLQQFMKSNVPNDPYPYKVVFPAPNSAQNVGVMSKFPIVTTESNLDQPAFIRDLGEAKIDIPGYPLCVYVTHLKADPFYMGHHTPEEFQKAQQRRMEQVKAIHDVLVKDMPNVPSRHYIVAGDMNATPDSPEMQALRDPNSSTALIDPMAGHDGPETISHPATGHRYDYLMVSPEVAQSVVPGSAQVFRGSPDEEKASDHLPMVLTIDLDQKPPQTV